MTSEVTRWAVAVRVLALVSLILLVTGILEARTIRRARSEIQRLRTEREAVAANIVSAWTRQPADDLGRAIRWLDDFHRDPVDGFGRPAGLCAPGHVDDQAIATALGAAFLPARASGKSFDASVAVIRDQIVRTDQYRVTHPDLAPPRDPSRR